MKQHTCTTKTQAYLEKLRTLSPQSAAIIKLEMIENVQTKQNHVFILSRV